MPYDENTSCRKCGKKLPYSDIDYTYSHGGGLHNDTYKKVDMKFAKEVGLDILCNECYDKIDRDSFLDMIDSGNNFLDEINAAKQDIEDFYKKKMDQLNEMGKLVLDILKSSKDKSTISEFSDDELRKINTTAYLYMSCYRNIRVGYPHFYGKPYINDLISK